MANSHGTELLEKPTVTQLVMKFTVFSGTQRYEGCLKSSWTQLITPSQDLVEVR